MENVNESESQSDILESRTSENSRDFPLPDSNLESNLGASGINLSVRVENNLDSDSDSTVLVKDETDQSSNDTVIYEYSPRGNNKKLKNEPTDDGSQQSSTSVPETSCKTSKRSYDDMRSYKDDNEQICPICLEIWTSEGEHRLCSLKCGHLFGKSCIYNWLVKQKKHCCPQCNKKANSYEIRDLFATKLIALDCSEKLQLEREIEKVKEEKRMVEIELAKCRLFAENYKQEVAKLQAELAKLAGKAENISFNRGFKFHLEKTLHINDGCCRVCTYDVFSKTLLVCHQSKNPLFPGFGIKRIHRIGYDYNGNNFLHLHSKTIRDIKFHPLLPNVILTVAFDKSAKLCDLQKQTITQTFVADYALWSCSWDEEDPNFFYVGTGKGTVYVFDTRSPGIPVAELKLSGDTSSVVSLCYVPSKPPEIPYGGIICCRLNSVVFYKKTGSNEFNSIRFHSLVGPFFSLIYNSASGHIVVSCRPSTAVPNVRHMFCELNGDQCQPIHVCVGGTVQSMLSRPCFIEINKETLIAAFNQNTNLVEIWSTSTGSKVSNFHVSEEIYDLASITIGERIFIATIGSSSVRFYETS